MMQTPTPLPEMPPASLYAGTVMHARMKPKPHRFSYGVTNLLIDIGRLEEADRLSPLFGINRAAPVSFHERDHGPRDGTSLSAHIAHLLADLDLAEAPARTLLWCYPRVLGIVFNPLSVYYVHAASGRLVALVYEVRNTFGGLHTYALPVTTEEQQIRQTCAKDFYVSPFIDMPMRYHFRMEPPGQTLKVRILETDADGPILAATFSGRIRPLTSKTILSTLLAVPVQTLKIVGGIHYEALRLWLKGVPYFAGTTPAAGNAVHHSLPHPQVEAARSSS
jgi:DUF1365 family protein